MYPPPFRITPVKHSDIQDISDIEASCFRRPWSKEAFNAELFEKNAIARVLRRAQTGEAAGYIFARTLLEEVHILKVAVAHRFRRSGGGTMLLQNVLDISRHKGASKAFLEVRSSNLTAIALYEKIGFHVAGVRPGYYIDEGCDAIMMEKNLL